MGGARQGGSGYLNSNLKPAGILDVDRIGFDCGQLDVEPNPHVQS